MIEIRKAEKNDLKAIVELIIDDEFNQSREGSSEKYGHAFSEILLSNYFDVYEIEKDEEVIGCYQIMYLPHLSFMGTKRAQIESVRIRSDLRGNGYGALMIEHAKDIAQKAGCAIMQLTSNKKRVKASNFYKKLGFSSTHEGYKIYF